GIRGTLSVRLPINDWLTKVGRARRRRAGAAITGPVERKWPVGPSRRSPPPDLSQRAGPRCLARRSAAAPVVPSPRTLKWAISPMARILSLWRASFPPAALILVVFLGTGSEAAGQNDFIVLSPSREGAPQTAAQTDGRVPEVHRLLDCIFRRMDLGYQLAPMPSRRAEMAFDDGLATAILDAYQGSLLDLPSYA